jgi:threonine/homoserine/homoserine lactone efflux protein
MGIGQVLGFAGTTVVLVGMPGPNNLYISLRSLTQGRRAGVVSALAIETGTLVYIVVTAFGLATLVQTSPTLFTAITIAGALYLAYLGFKLLRAPTTEESGDVQAAPLGRVFRDAIGRANQALAAAAAEVHLLIAGIPVRIKPSSGM